MGRMFITLGLISFALSVFGIYFISSGLLCNGYALYLVILNDTRVLMLEIFFISAPH